MTHFRPEFTTIASQQCNQGFQSVLFREGTRNLDHGVERWGLETMVPNKREITVSVSVVAPAVAVREMPGEIWPLLRMLIQSTTKLGK
jgi:hypothetical protein